MDPIESLHTFTDQYVLVKKNEGQQIKSALLRLCNKTRAHPISEYSFNSILSQQADCSYTANHVIFYVNDCFLYHANIEVRRITLSESCFIAFSLTLVDFGKNVLNDTQDGLSFIKSEDAQINRAVQEEKRPCIVFYLDNQCDVLFYHLNHDPVQTDRNTFMGVFFRMIKEPFLYALLKHHTKTSRT